jgi:hypothetical protein
MINNAERKGNYSTIVAAGEGREGEGKLEGGTVYGVRGKGSTGKGKGKG